MGEKEKDISTIGYIVVQEFLFQEKIKLVSLIFSLFVLLIILSCNSVGERKEINEKCSSVYDSIANQVVYTSTDEMPVFPGGTNAILDVFAKNYKYPDQDYLQATFILEFVIDTSGRITHQRIKDKGTNNLTLAEKEALRILELLPLWRPGRCSGELVPVRTFIPLKF